MRRRDFVKAASGLFVPAWAQASDSFLPHRRKAFRGGSTLLDNLVAWWDLESDATDSHSGGYDLTENGTISYTDAGISAAVGNGVEFAATATDYLSLASPPSGMRGGDGHDWHIGGWIVPDTLAYHTVAAMIVSSNLEWLIRTKDSTSGEYFQFYVWNGTALTAVASTTSWAANAQIRFDCIYNSSANQISIAWNSVLGTPLSLTAAQRTGTPVFQIARRESTAQPFDGHIAQFMIREAVPTQDELDELYNSGSGISYADL